MVKTKTPVNRGEHAHKQATQWFICITGRVEIEVFDGEAKANFIIKPGNSALEIPPGLWTKQNYEANTSLLVITDFKYEESEYVRDEKAFLEFKGIQ